MTVLRAVVSAVPLPQLGQDPGFYSPSAVVVVTGALTIVAVILFVFNSLASNGLAKLGISPLPRVLISAGVMITIGVVFILAAIHDQNAHKVREDAYWDIRMASLRHTTDALNEHYGIDVDMYDVPLKELRFPYDIDLRWPNGRDETCLVQVVDGLYEIRCGSDEWDEAVPLVPVNGAAS